MSLKTSTIIFTLTRLLSSSSMVSLERDFYDFFLLLSGALRPLVHNLQDMSQDWLHCVGLSSFDWEKMFHWVSLPGAPESAGSGWRPGGGCLAPRQSAAAAARRRPAKCTLIEVGGMNWPNFWLLLCEYYLSWSRGSHNQGSPALR